MLELSVIIPSYQRGRALRACLSALGKQTLECGNFEVIVVDDGSDDGTYDFLSPADYLFPLRVLRQDNAGQGAARNFGSRDAVGKYLLFLDDDVVASPALLEEHLALHSVQHGAVGLGRISYDVKGNDWYLNAFADCWNRRYEQLQAGCCDWQDLYSANVSLSRSMFDEVGGFAEDRRPGEDAELGCRLQASGAKFVYLPKAIANHPNTKTRDDILSDAQAQGAASVLLAQRHNNVLATLSAAYDEIRIGQLLLLRILNALCVPGYLLSTPGRLLSREMRLRWQKSVQKYAYWRGVIGECRRTDDATRNAFASGTPILAYHAFTDDADRASRFVVTEGAFARQMQHLHENGLNVISLQQFVTMRRDDLQPPDNTVVLTFDDGYEDFIRFAWPVLKEFGFGGTVFLVTDLLGKTNTWDSDGELHGRRLLSRQQVAELSVAGIEFGAHTKTHPNLIGIAEDSLLEELKGPIDELGDVLGDPPVSFAYPYGEYESRIADAVARCGYLSACTVRNGLNAAHANPFELRRIEIFGTDSLARFRLKVRYGYRRPRIRQLLKAL